MAKRKATAPKKTASKPKAAEKPNVSTEEKAKPSVQKTNKTADPNKERAKQQFEVTVTHADMDQENQNVPIHSTYNGKKRVIHPKQKVTMSLGRIQTLRDCRLSFEKVLEPESTIYQERDMLGAAQRAFPGCSASLDRATGRIILSFDEPRFHINFVRDDAEL